MRLPYRWWPSGARSTYGRPPEAGQVVAWDHGAWRVIDISAVPAERWDEQDHRKVQMGYKPPYRVTLRPASVTGDDPRDRDHDIHLRACGATWHVFDTEHYPVCAACREPLPCREQMAERVSQAAAERMSRYDMPGVCPACGEPVTSRQRSMTFADNLEVLAGPPVTYHVGRAGCRHSAALYEQRWVAADPEQRKATLSCSGHVTNHNNGTYECTQFGECPGPEAEHTSYTVCGCADCHARGSFGCHPGPKDELVNRQLPDRPAREETPNHG